MAISYTWKVNNLERIALLANPVSAVGMPWAVE